VIVLASYHDEATIARALSNGASGPLYKPIHTEELRRLLLQATVPAVPSGNGSQRRLAPRSAGPRADEEKTLRPDRE
jgi:DNA-binding NarL/FixJ family response regulator